MLNMEGWSTGLYTERSHSATSTSTKEMRLKIGSLKDILQRLEVITRTISLKRQKDLSENAMMEPFRSCTTFSIWPGSYLS